MEGEVLSDQRTDDRHKPETERKGIETGENREDSLEPTSQPTRARARRPVK